MLIFLEVKSIYVPTKFRMVIVRFLKRLLVPMGYWTPK
jgi:hypothetical protein